MKRFRFVFSRRWLTYIACAIVFAIACVLLANWQLARSKQAAAANAIVAHNFNGVASPLGQALPSLVSFANGQEWQRVTATGRYLPEQQLLVRNRTIGSGGGYEVLTPLRLADGSLFIVDRGFVPMDAAGHGPAHIAPAPSGEVTVTARLKPSEPGLPGQSAAGRQIPTIQLSLVARMIGGGHVYTGAYGLLQSQSPQPDASLTPVVTSPPTQDEGLHWSYMIQWIIFAIIGFFGLGYAIRQEYKHRYDDPEQVAREEEERAKRRAGRPRTDAEIEDELLDAQ